MSISLSLWPNISKPKLALLKLLTTQMESWFNARSLLDMLMWNFPHSRTRVKVANLCKSLLACCECERLPSLRKDSSQFSIRHIPAARTLLLRTVGWPKAATGFRV